jgi:hypothetical protein
LGKLCGRVHSDPFSLLSGRRVYVPYRRVLVTARRRRARTATSSGHSRLHSAYM